MNYADRAFERDPYNDTSPADMRCSADPFVLSCFQAYKTALEPWHAGQLEWITNQIISFARMGRPVTHVLVIGHAADWKASDDTMGLGLGRAHSVMAGLRRLLALGGPRLARLPLLPLSFGDIEPVADNATQAGRRLNRRVSIHLLHAPPARPIECKPLDDETLRNGVLELLGRGPKEYDVISELGDAIRRADTRLCRMVGRRMGRWAERNQRKYSWMAKGPSRDHVAILAWLGCMFVNVAFIQPLQEEFKDEPKRQLANIRGAAYAIMDAATKRQRMLNSLPNYKSQDGAFQAGYHLMQARILMLRGNPESRTKLEEFLAGLACRKNYRVAITIIYRTILKVIISEARSGHEFLKASGYCSLAYPQVRKLRCGPTPY